MNLTDKPGRAVGYQVHVVTRSLVWQTSCKLLSAEVREAVRNPLWDPVESSTRDLTGTVSSARFTREFP